MNSVELKWFRSRMVAARWGLLAPEEEQRFEQLLEAPVCRGLWEVFLEDEVGAARGEDRLPEALLENWPRRSAALTGMARALVRQHLERNESSRRELRERGWEARLYTKDELDAPGVDSARLVRRKSASWWLGGWAGLATAAALALALLRVPGERFEPGFRSDELPLPLPVMRGAEAIQARALEEGRSLEVLLVLDWRDRSRALVELLAPDGSRLAGETLIAPSDGGVSYRRLTYRSTDPLSPGRYILRLRYEGAGGAETEDRPFEVTP